MSHLHSLLPARSWLFVPGNRPDRFQKALDTAADKVIVDLEDSVPPTERVAARAALASELAAGLADAPTARLVARINAVGSADFEADVDALPLGKVGAVLAPKVDAVASVAALERALVSREAACGAAAKSTGLVLLIESARGVRDADGILEAAGGLGRRCAAAFGAMDFSVDVGTEGVGADQELLYARSRLVVASRAAGLDGPFDSPCAQLRDAASVATEAVAARRLGFQGKLCVHPAQIAACNEAFTPGDDALADARAVVAAYEAVESDGLGAVQHEGRMIDLPVVERARRTLALAEQVATTGEGRRHG